MGECYTVVMNMYLPEYATSANCHRCGNNLKGIQRRWCSLLCSRLGLKRLWKMRTPEVQRASGRRARLKRRATGRVWGKVARSRPKVSYFVPCSYCPYGVCPGHKNKKKCHLHKRLKAIPCSLCPGGIYISTRVKKYCICTHAKLALRHALKYWPATIIPISTVVLKRLMSRFK